MAVFSDIIGTLRNTFRIAKATFDSAGLTAARTFTLPDQAGTIKLANAGETAAGKLYAARNLR